MSDMRGNQGGQWQAGGPAAGWYPDPWDEHRRRYWDGHAWTGDVSFEPPGSWGERSGATQVAPAHPGAQATQSQPGSGPYPAQHPAQTQQWPAQTPAWGAAAPAPYGGGAGYGGPPQHPAWYGQQGWPQGDRRPAHPNGRIHVGIVALIAVIAIFAGIGIGSQVNSSSRSAATGSGGGTSGGANPFGGGGTSGSSGSGGSGAATSGGTLTPSQHSLASTIDRSVVDINTELGFQNGAAAGTGMILTANGTILTNNHVIDGATSVSVTVVSTGKTYKGTVVGDDVTQDVAVVQMQSASGLTPISLGIGSSVSRDDPVIAIGNAEGAGGTPSAVSGSVTALGQSITASDENGANAENLVGLIQTDAPIEPGDSGGPLVNARGQVIGMDTAASSSNSSAGSTDEGFAIPIGEAANIASQIEKGQATGKVHIGATGFLGVEVQPSTGDGLPGSIGSGNGASVSGVIADSPAAQVGLAMGDTITGVSGEQIASSTDLTKVLRVHHPGDQVSVTWIDTDGTSHTATVTLAPGPAA